MVVAQSLYRENISTIVVSDHNTISGIKKMEKAIKIVSELNINKGKEYIEVINGVRFKQSRRPVSGNCLEHYMFPLFQIPNNNRHSSHKRKGDNYSQDDHQ